MALNYSDSQRPTASAAIDDHMKLRLMSKLLYDRFTQIGPDSARTPYARASAGRVLSQITAAGLARFTPSNVDATLPYCGRYEAVAPNSVLAEVAHRVAVRIERAESGVAA